MAQFHITSDSLLTQWTVSCLDGTPTTVGGKAEDPICMRFTVKGGFSELVQLHFQLNRDDLTEHDRQIHEKITAASGRNIKQDNHWFRDKV